MPLIFLASVVGTFLSPQPSLAQTTAVTDYTYNSDGALTSSVETVEDPSGNIIRTVKQYYTWDNCTPDMEDALEVRSI